MDDEVTERIRILLDLEQEAHDRAAKKSAREIARLERSYDPLSRATIKYQQESAKLANGLEKGTITAERHAQLLDKVQREYDQTTSRLAKLNSQMTKHAKTSGGLVGVMNRNKNAFQQLGYQVGDFAVQVGGGTSAITAFSQQGSQLLGVFGAWGAIAGAAVAIGAPLAGAFFKQAEGAEEAGDATDAFGSALDRYKGYAKIAMSSTAELREEFGEYASDVREFSQYMAKVEVGQALNAISGSEFASTFAPAIAAAEKYAAKLADAEAWAKSMGIEINQLDPELLILKGTAAKLADEMELTVDQVRTLGPLIKRFNESDSMPGVAKSARELLERMRSIYSDTTRIPPTVAEIMKQLERVHSQARLVATTMEKVEDTADDLAKTDIAAGIRAAVISAGDLGKRLAEALGLGQQISGLDFGNFDLHGFAERLQERILNSDAPIGQPRSQFDRSGVSDSALRSMSLLEQAARQVFTVTSAHRDKAHNASVGGAKHSEHINGNAFDISTSGMSRARKIEIIQIARQVAGFGGVGVYSDSLHFDTGKTRAWGPDYTSGSIPAWAAQATQTPRAGEAAAKAAKARELANAEREAAQAARESEAATRDQAQALSQSQEAIDGLRRSVYPLVAAEQDYAEVLAKVGQALKNGQITAEQAMAMRAHFLAEYNQQVQDIQAKLAEPPAKSGEIKALEQQYKSLTQTLVQAKRAGENVGEALSNWVLDATLQAGIQQLAQALAQMGGGSGIGGILGGLLGNANGNAFSGGNVVPFANGGAFSNGIVSSPTLFPMVGSKTGLMGEAGPEAIMPLKRINGKLGVAASGGGGRTVVNQPITIDARGAQEGVAVQIRRELQRAMPEIERRSVEAAYRSNGEEPFR